MRLRLTLAAVCYLSASLPAAGQESAPVSVTGRVQAAWKVEVVAAQGDRHYSVSAHSEGIETIRVEIALRSGSAPEGRVTVVVSLRTNAPRFQFFAVPGDSALLPECGSPQPGGNGSLLSAGALAGFRSFPAGAEGGAGPRLLAEGARVSSRGSFVSPHNALLAPVHIRIPAQTGSPSAHVVRLHITP